MNKVLMSGIIVGKKADSKTYHFFPANNGKKAMLSFAISVKVPYAKKDESTGYYPTALWFCKCWGMTAEMIDQHCDDGAAISVEGYLVQESGNGEYPDRTTLYVNEMEFCPVGRNTKAAGTTTANKTAASVTYAARSNMMGTKAPAAAAPKVANSDIFNF